jgi:hypothetical protein
MLSVADGQLATSATALYTGIAAQVQANVTCLNTSGSTTETVILTLTRGSGTARRIARAVLAPNEQLFVTGIPLASGDVIKGSTTDANTVDYVVATTQTDIAFKVWTLDTSGAQKQVASGVSGNQAVAGRLAANVLSMQNQPTDTYSAAMTIDVTKSSHVISVSNTTSAASTFTPSAAGTEGDLLFILTEADASGTVTVTFASTFHSSGTQATTASKFSSILFQSDGSRWVEIARSTALS